MTAASHRMRRAVARPRSGVAAQQVFFPAAALCAAVLPWLLLASLAGCAPLVDVSTHARSLLFGFVGALLAGYLGGKLPPWQLGGLFALWLLGRLAELLPVAPWLMHTLYITFGVLLAALVAPRFRAAKKWRNRAVGPLLVAICAFPFLIWVQSVVGVSTQRSLYGLLLLLSLLMFFMGGRLITPLLARAYADTGGKIPQRVQPRIEAAVMLLLAFASVCSVLALHAMWVALPVAAAALLLILRLYRWHLFALGQRADIAALGSGYLWLGAGLLLVSLALMGRAPIASSLHLVTIGALGTLSSCVMLKQSARAAAPQNAVYAAVAGMIGIAAIARFLVDSLPQYRPLLLVVSGLAWSANYLMVACYVCNCKGDAT